MASGTDQVRAVYDALNDRDYDRAAKNIAEGAVILSVATGDVYRGRSGFLELARGWGAALPDLRLALTNVAGDGQRAVAEYEIFGTHTGSLVTPRGHIPPTGMDVQVRVCDVIELADGKISHIRSYFDSVALLRQLGIIAGTPLHPPDRRSPLGLYAQPVEAHRSRNKAIVQRFIKDVYNRQDPNAAADTCRVGYQWHGGSLGDTRGLTAYQQVLATLFVAFPDLRMEVLDSLADEDRVMIRFAMHGTHRGPFQGVPPTFRNVSGGGTSTYRLENGRIAEEWWQGDVLELLQQMDAAPSTGPLSS